MYFLFSSCIKKKEPVVDSKPVTQKDFSLKKDNRSKTAQSVGGYWSYLKKKCQLNNQQIEFLKEKRQSYADGKIAKEQYLNEIQTYLGSDLYKRKYNADVQWNLSPKK